jgi:5-methylcytosine-specific restriction endonuclease McrA
MEAGAGSLRLSKKHGQSCWKVKRVVDRELLDLYQGRECLICGMTKTTIGHHIVSKGAGGPDIHANLMPLCHVHHDEIHKLHTKLFCEKYEKAALWLEYWGWQKNGRDWFPPWSISRFSSN